ncbi:MAG TPA: response regulator [Thermodesulfobacteriota bacterium]
MPRETTDTLPTLLVVDDEPAVLEALVEAMSDRGFAVLTAESGTAALALAAQNPVDVVLLDLCMPGMDGIATLEALKARDPDVEVIVVTAHASLQTAVSAIKRQAYDYIAKPFDLDALERLVRRALTQRRLRAEIRSVTARAEALEARYHELAAVARVGEAILRGRDLPSVLAGVLDVTLAVGGFDEGAIHILDGDGRRWGGLSMRRGGRSTEEGPAALEDLPHGRLLADAVARRRAVVNAPAAASGVAGAAAWVVAVPVIGGGAVTGVLELASYAGRPVPAAELRTLEMIGTAIGLGLEKVRLEEAARQAGHGLTASEQARERLAAVLEATPDPVTIADATGRRVYMNQAGRRLLGLGDTADISHTTLADNRPAWARTLVLEEAVPSAIRDGAWRGEAALLTPDGEEVPVSQVIVAHRGTDGAVAFLSTIEHDLRDQRQLEAELREATKFEALGRLAGGVAHDFNNYLTAIGGFCERLREQLEPGSPAILEAEEIQRTVDRATALTRQLLAVGRRQVLKPRLVDVNAVISGMLPLVRQLAGDRVQVVTALAPSLGRIRTDPAQIEQVLTNLVVNARDAMPDGGTLTIETANTDLDVSYARRHVSVRPGAYVLLAVSDTGIGMSRETRDRLFEPFFTTKAPGKGTGLGLSTVYGIVKQSGGNIWVYSEPGRGATFKIYLPRVPEAVEAHPAPAPAVEAPRDAQTILLVEDDDLVRRLARQALEDSGYRILEASDGDDAKRVSETHAGPIDLLLTDVVMPRLNGPDLARLLAAARPGLPVLYMSGYADQAIYRSGVLDQGASFLAKPFTLEALRRRVREAVKSGNRTGGAPAS